MSVLDPLDASPRVDPPQRLIPSAPVASTFCRVACVLAGALCGSAIWVLSVDTLLLVSRGRSGSPLDERRAQLPSGGSGTKANAFLITESGLTGRYCSVPLLFPSLVLLTPKASSG